MPVLWVEAFVWFEEECIWADGIWEIAQGVQEKGNQTIWTLCVWFWKKSVEKRPLYQVTTDEVVMQPTKELPDLVSFFSVQKRS